jgi:hypothetical protein
MIIQYKLHKMLDNLDKGFPIDYSDDGSVKSSDMNKVVVGNEMTGDKTPFFMKLWLM